MQPTLNENVNGDVARDRVWLDKFSIQMLHRYRRGDVVVLKSPERPGDCIVKRLIGLEGDWVKMRDGKSVLIPKGKCWIEGDNAVFSDDSDKYGPVPMALIDSRVIAVVWPPEHAKLVRNALPENRVNEN